MDWDATTQALRDGAPGIALVGATLPAFAWAAEPGKRFVACAPGLVAVAVFVASCVASAFGAWGDASGWMLVVLFVGVVALIAPSFHALREHWFVLLHGGTLLATAYLWLIASVWLGRDGP